MQANRTAQNARVGGVSKRNKIHLDVMEAEGTGLYLEPNVVEEILVNQLRFGDFRRWRVAENGIEGTRLISIIRGAT